MITSLVLLAAFSAAGVDSLPDQEQAQRFDEGRALFDGGHFTDAAEIFLRLYRQSGDAALLYPAAQSLRLAHSCTEALHAYEEFAAAGPRLRARPDQPADNSRSKRLASDLQYARARVVEMRVCVGRIRRDAARQQLEVARTSGDANAAIAVLLPIWEEIADATVLPDLADLHRTLGHCQKARSLLDDAVAALAPVEVLHEADEAASDLVAARSALARARTGRAGMICVPDDALPGTEVSRAASRQVAAAPPAAGPATPPQHGTALASAATPVASASPDATAGFAEKHARGPRRRWPVWVAGGGGALLVGGATFFLLTYQTENKVEMYRTMPWDPDEGGRLLDRGKWYSRAAFALSGAGALLVTTGVIFYFREPSAAVVPAVQMSAHGMALAWTACF